jgi:hypothetical protein
MWHETQSASVDFAVVSSSLHPGANKNARTSDAQERGSPGRWDDDEASAGVFGGARDLDAVGTERA